MKSASCMWCQRVILSDEVRLSVGYRGKFFKILSSKIFKLGNDVSRQEMTENSLPVRMKNVLDHSEC